MREAKDNFIIENGRPDEIDLFSAIIEQTQT